MFFEVISEGTFISSEYFSKHTFKKGRLLSLYSEEQKYFYVFSGFTSNLGVHLGPFVQMSEGINLFPQLGCPISTPDLSSFILPLQGINIFSKHPEKDPTSVPI